MSTRKYLATWAAARYPLMAGDLMDREAFGGPLELKLNADFMPKEPRDVVRRWDRMYLHYCQKLVTRKVGQDEERKQGT